MVGKPLKSLGYAEVTKLMSELKVPVLPRHRNLSSPLGPEGRINKLRQTVTALVKYERIELFHNRADEARGYVERLVSDARRYGDQNKEMMEMASYWLLEKQLVHKLFKVICPRFHDTFDGPFTTAYNAPRKYPSETERKQYFKRVVLELKGHPFPPLLPQASYQGKYLIHNVLLDAAMKDYYQEKKLNAMQNKKEEVTESVDEEKELDNQIKE
ncbi:hypothetical protein PVAND_002840 [Polypedilum vanderplanki]|uniref:Large ribosomal subunit protein bL17m n=1 Tax=Polypedilum vanderplanki TaxID=319348 RepID=A0A9J6BTC7_POLVA|nr:hypothetical protein PVAND_002840 [Polypedilum vanderplanki]